MLETSDFIRFAGVEISFYPVFPSDLEYKTQFHFTMKVETDEHKLLHTQMT